MPALRLHPWSCGPPPPPLVLAVPICGTRLTRPRTLVHGNSWGGGVPVSKIPAGKKEGVPPPLVVRLRPPPLEVASPSPRTVAVALCASTELGSTSLGDSIPGAIASASWPFEARASVVGGRSERWRLLPRAVGGSGRPRMGRMASWVRRGGVRRGCWRRRPPVRRWFACAAACRWFAWPRGGVRDGWLGPPVDLFVSAAPPWRRLLLLCVVRHRRAAAMGRWRRQFACGGREGNANTAEAVNALRRVQLKEVDRNRRC